MIRRSRKRRDVASQEQEDGGMRTVVFDDTGPETLHQVVGEAVGDLPVAQPLVVAEPGEGEVRMGSGEPEPEVAEDDTLPGVPARPFTEADWERDFCEEQAQSESVEDERATEEDWEEVLDDHVADDSAEVSDAMDEASAEVSPPPPDPVAEVKKWMDAQPTPVPRISDERLSQRIRIADRWRDSSPKAAGSDARHNWGLYVDGMQVAAYLAHPEVRGGRKRARRDLAWDVEHGHVWLQNPSEWALEEAARKPAGWEEVES